MLTVPPAFSNCPLSIIQSNPSDVRWIDHTDVSGGKYYSMARYIQKIGSFVTALKMPPFPAVLIPETSNLETPSEGHDAVRVNAATDSAQTFQIRTIQALDGCPKQRVIPV